MLGSVDRVKCGIDVDNSLSIRKSLLRPGADDDRRQAGPFGLGLDAFQRHRLLPAWPPHQHHPAGPRSSSAESARGHARADDGGGTPGGSSRSPDPNRAATFLLCALAYASALLMVHGRLSRQGDLFLLLGASAGLVASRKLASQERPRLSHSFVEQEEKR
jgi:hypothetical protein